MISKLKRNNKYRHSDPDRVSIDAIRIKPELSNKPITAPMDNIIIPITTQEECEFFYASNPNIIILGECNNTWDELQAHYKHLDSRCTRIGIVQNTVGGGEGR